MSTIRDIERAIVGLSDTEFHRFCDAFLECKGYGRPAATGRSVGREQSTTGTPDTLFTRPDGRYVLAEYTTKERDLAPKLRKDLDNCLDESKTGIALSEIEAIVICYTHHLAASHIAALHARGQASGCRVDTFDAAAIANDVNRYQRPLIPDMLGIPLDRDQVVTVDEFRAGAVAGLLAGHVGTPLDGPLRARAKELADIAQALAARQLVVLSGAAGVGKTHLALVAAEQFASTNDHVVRCIRYRSGDVFDDVIRNLSGAGSYVVVFDDANRIGGFKGVLDYLAAPASPPNIQRSIAIIATVRDYAVREVELDASEVCAVTRVHLDPLKDEDIAQILEDRGILNHIFIDRITDVSKGNARLAVMAADVALRDGTLQSIADVTTLYDAYFGPVVRELNALDDDDVLRVAAIIGLFRAIDGDDQALLELIEGSFGVTPERFWNGVRKLHQYELVDMHGQSAARVSNQVLATYLFYRAVFRQHIVDFADVLRATWPAYRHRLFDALNPVLVAFNAESMVAQIRPSIVAEWERLEGAHRWTDLLAVANAFWVVDPDRALALARNATLDRLSPAPVANTTVKTTESAKEAPQVEPPTAPAEEAALVMDTATEPRNSSDGVLEPAGPSGRTRLRPTARQTELTKRRLSRLLPTAQLDESGVLSLLTRFAEDQRLANEAVELVIEYFDHHPGESPQVITALRRFGFDRRHLPHFIAPTEQMMNAVWRATRVGSDRRWTLVFLSLASHLLAIHRSEDESSGMSVRIFRYDLTESESLRAFRTALWQRIGTVWAAVRADGSRTDEGANRLDVYDLLEGYIQGAGIAQNRAVFEADVPTVVQMLLDTANPSDWREARVVRRYMKALNSWGIAVPGEIARRFRRTDRGVVALLNREPRSTARDWERAKALHTAKVTNAATRSARRGITALRTFLAEANEFITDVEADSSRAYLERAAADDYITAFFTAAPEIIEEAIQTEIGPLLAILPHPARLGQLAALHLGTAAVIALVDKETSTVPGDSIDGPASVVRSRHADDVRDVAENDSVTHATTRHREMQREAIVVGALIACAETRSVTIPGVAEGTAATTATITDKDADDPRLPTDARKPCVVTSALADRALATFQGECVGAGYGLDWLLPFRVARSTILIEALQIMVDRSEADESAASVLAPVFDHYGEVATHLEEYFSPAVPLLIRGYLIADRSSGRTTDFDARSWGLLARLETTFPARFIDSLFAGYASISHNDDQRHYAKVWLLDRYDDILDRTIDRIYEQEHTRWSFESYAIKFLEIDMETRDSALIVERQEAFLSERVRQWAFDSDRSTWLFALIRRRGDEFMRTHLKTFIELNMSADAFARLPFAPGMWHGHGSFIPAYEHYRAFLTSLLPLLNGVAYIDHRLHVNAQIAAIDKRIEEEKRRNFMQD